MHTHNGTQPGVSSQQNQNSQMLHKPILFLRTSNSSRRTSENSIDRSTSCVHRYSCPINVLRVEEDCIEPCSHRSLPTSTNWYCWCKTMGKLRAAKTISLNYLNNVEPDSNSNIVFLCVINYTILQFRIDSGYSISRCSAMPSSSHCLRAVTTSSLSLYRQ